MDTKPVILEKAPFPVEREHCLSAWTTFQLGGACRGVVTCRTQDTLVAAVTFLSNRQQPFIVIGAGSNLVVSDKGLDCFVVRFIDEDAEMCDENGRLRVSAAALLDDVSAFAADDGLQGLTFASGIPGTVGGALVGNAGAYGQQIGDLVESVTLLAQSGRVATVAKEQLDFSYRHSALKSSGDIVLSVTLKVRSGQSDALQAERRAILDERLQKHPDWKKIPTAGSFFRNVESTSAAQRRQAAGWYLQETGGKALASGGARIFERHANIIVASETCRAQDVYDLSLKMQKAVSERFGIDLVREVRFVGQFDGMPDDIATIIW